MPITNNAVTTGMTKEVAVAGPPRVLPAGGALPKAPRAEARKAHPAEAVPLPLAVQAAVVPAPLPGVATPDNNATQAVSSPAAAGAPVMAAVIQAATTAAIPATAVPGAVVAAIPATAAAPAAARQPNDASHSNKQIELATALFVCSKII